MRAGASPGSSRRTHVTSGFFVLRAPLLPFDVLAELSAGLSATGIGTCGRDPKAESGSALDRAGSGLDSALAEERARVRERLSALTSRCDVREALFVASPDLEQNLGVWLEAPLGERGQRIERAIYRYLARMSGRATPFGLFAACSVG